MASLKSKGQLISNPEGRAELLVDEFLSVFTTDNNQEIPSVSSRVEEDIPPLLIGEDGVFQLLHSIKIKWQVQMNSQIQFSKSVHEKSPLRSQRSSKNQ